MKSLTPGRSLLRRFLQEVVLIKPLRQVSLAQVFGRFPLEVNGPIPDLLINGIVSDSRQVQPGNLFMALSGGSTDGHRYIPDAIQRGAAVVVGSQPPGSLTVPYIQVPEGRRALAFLAAGFFDYPAHKLVVIGVTGTDGKTTTCSLIYSILKAAGIRAGLISTVNAVIGDQVLDTGFHVTTPDAQDVQAYLAEMVESGLTHVILEATSHGLAQFRVEACEFDLGVVTNITHEHLDYHATFEAYRAAKARLFTGLADTPPKAFFTPRTAVLNRDDASFEYLSSLAAAPVVSYGLMPKADVTAEAIHQTRNGLRFVATGKNFRFPVASRLLGDFNVSNCLAALTAASVLKIEPEVVQQGINDLAGIPGRMEIVDLGQDFTTIVDFAHTPNALRCALQTARQLTKGRVITAFGSAGLRDRAKRRMMAEIAIELADMTIFTAEDPRTETLEDILAEMAKGASDLGGVETESFWRIPDRGEALRFGVWSARPGDVLIACGKGHEKSMCFGTIEYDWDDRTALLAALSERLHLDGPPMPYLPTQKR
jgi:UDP-N-acetylmuramoyl-L-alanyl-D-glutamate--2,6-diaminopimelate ligase